MSVEVFIWDFYFEVFGMLSQVYLLLGQLLQQLFLPFFILASSVMLLGGKRLVSRKQTD